LEAAQYFSIKKFETFLWEHSIWKEKFRIFFDFLHFLHFLYFLHFLHFLHLDFFALYFLFLTFEKVHPFPNLVKGSKNSGFEPVEKTYFFLRLWKVLKEKNVNPSFLFLNFFYELFVFCHFFAKFAFFDQKLFSKKANFAKKCSFFLQKSKKNQKRQSPLSKFWYTKVFSSKRCFNHSDFAFFDSAFFDLKRQKMKKKISDLQTIFLYTIFLKEQKKEKKVRKKKEKKVRKKKEKK
jgi:hypothetical protein